MSTKRIDLTGMRFGTLTVISEVLKRNKHGQILYNVKCDCGKEKQTLGASMKRGLTRSCNTCHLLTGSHGMHKSREFKIWSSMKSRCSNPNEPNYKRYGGRGIKVCDDWLESFVKFYRDMGNSNGLTLDRIDVNGNYEPSNCRWATCKIQSRNKTNNIFYTYNGETLCVSEWLERISMASSTFCNRIKRGWSFEKSITTPVRAKSNNHYNIRTI